MMISSWQQLSEYKKDNYASGDLVDRQEMWLMDCIKHNANTEFGKLHHFSKIKTMDDYRALVPVHSFSDLSEEISKIEKGESDILFSGEAIAFERTSGSIAGQKLIPYSENSLLDFRHAILPWLSDVASEYNLTEGSAYWAISPATRDAEVTEGGLPVGMPDAAYLGEDVIPFFHATSAVPQWVGTVSDFREWQLATLYYLVCSRDLVFISVWSPTFLLSLLDALQERKHDLEHILLNGGTMSGKSLAKDLLAYEILKTYYKNMNPKTLWPDLKIISCWADASSLPFYQQLNKQFPDVPIQPKGLLLTEGVVTIPNQVGHTVLSADSGFYEFSDSESNIKLAHELIKGECYDVIMTTSGGLYRYRSHDRVVCDGYYSDLPILRFVGRGDCSSDLVGEKLTEEFVTRCFDGIPGFKMLLPVHDETPGYLLVVEEQSEQSTDSVRDKVETRLFNNPHYEYACKLGQLQRLRVLRLKNPLNMYLMSPEHSGARFGDIKVPSLCIKENIFDTQIGTAA